MNFFDDRTLKKILYTFVGVLLVAIIALVAIFIWYDSKLSSDAEQYSLSTEEYDIEDFTEQASSTQDKNIVESNANETKNISNTNNTNKSTNVNISTKSENKTSSNTNSEKKENTQNTENTKKEEEVAPKVTKKELKFEAPVSGEILKDFANETLVYSKTLDEWTTHLGIDIKGDKTSIVKASEDGTVESIKNDPRYGLTVTISHTDGFKTVYSNLLTAEFVSEGASVSKGDTIGTIGETASFEILDECHLHFEMYKDETAVNPTLYLK